MESKESDKGKMKFTFKEIREHDTAVYSIDGTDKVFMIQPSKMYTNLTKEERDMAFTEMVERGIEVDQTTEKIQLKQYMVD